MSIHARPRATIDVDLLAPPAAVAAALATVVSPAGLVELKRLRGSAQDLADIALLEARL